MITIMRGLRKPEEERFERFFSLVQKEALTKDCVFFCDAGDGRDFIVDNMEGEDLFGWLIPLRDAESFEVDWMKNDPILDKWDSAYCSAEWNQSGDQISVSFNTYS